MRAALEQAIVSVVFFQPFQHNHRRENVTNDNQSMTVQLWLSPVWLKKAVTEVFLLLL